MSWMNRLAYLLRRHKLDRDLSDELRFHVEMRTRENIAAGMSPEEARYAALRAFGNVSLVKEVTHQMWGGSFWETLLQDARYGLWQLRRNPGFTVVAVLTLALGIGANTAIFSLLNTLFLRPLPVADPGRVVEVYRGEVWPCSYQDYLDFRDRNHIFVGLIADLPSESGLDVGGNSQVIQAEGVSGNYADVLRTKPLLGRWFSTEDERAAGQFPAVISYRVWQSSFEGDKQVLGKQVRMESQWYRVVGVAAQEFHGTSLPFATDLWVPLAAYAQHNERIKEIVQDREGGRIAMLGRLRPSITLAQAQAEMNVIDSQLRKEHPRPEATTNVLSVKGVRGVSDPGTRRSAGSLMILLMSVAGVVLLTACANVANLLLARGTSRRREVSIRLALGASRGRVFRQAMMESLLLALMGGVVGLIAATWTSRFLELSIPSLPLPITLGTNLAVDARVLAFALAASALTAALFGLGPALDASKPDLASALKGGEGLRHGQSRRISLRNLYVVAQVALSLTLLIVSGLFIRALREASRLDPGFDPHGLLSVRLYISKPEFTETTGREFYHRAQELASTLPGVKNTSLAYALPLGLTMSNCVASEGPANDLQATRAGSNIVGTNYFATMGIPLLGGRDFTPQDSTQASPVVIVNDALARRYWPNQNPLGRRLRIGDGCDKGKGQSVEIVGVVKDTKYASLDESPQPYVYIPFDQHFVGFTALVIKTEGDPSRLASTIRKELLRLDRRARIYDVDTLPHQVERSLWQVRWEATLLGAFGLLALLLAAVGLYGVIAYAMSRRTHEIGIRIALGAQQSDVLRLILTNGLALTFAGVGLGVAVSVIVTRLLHSFLYGLSPTDSVTFAASALLWTAVALVACYIPARRATKVDPMVALRHE